MLEDLDEIMFDEKPTRFDEDPLAILLACYPYHKQSHVPMDQLIKFNTNINDRSDRVIITSEHRKEAHVIARYYKNKIFTRMLTNQHTSDYRKELYNTLSKKDRFFLTSDEIRLLYRLPYFYYEDRWYDELEKSYGYKDGDILLDSFDLSNEPLTLVKSTVRFSKNVKQKQYWFNDQKNNLININVDLKNPFIGLFENELTRNNNVFTVSGSCNLMKIVERNIQVYLLTEWTHHQ